MKEENPSTIIDEFNRVYIFTYAKYEFKYEQYLLRIKI